MEGREENIWKNACFCGFHLNLRHTTNINIKIIHTTGAYVVKLLDFVAPTPHPNLYNVQL